MLRGCRSAAPTLKWRFARCAGFQELTVAQLAERLRAGGPLLVDVRSAAEFATGCAPRRAPSRCAVRGVTRPYDCHGQTRAGCGERAAG